MVDLRVIIDDVRRGMNDYVDPSDCDETTPLYSDKYYIGAIHKALSKFNCDTSNSYTLDTIPDGYLYILCLLSAINMAKTRFTRDQQLTQKEPSEGAVQRVQVPGLEVWYNKGQVVESSSWKEYIKLLTEEYDAWLKKRGYADRPVCALPVARSTVTHARSRRRHGARYNVLVDTGIPDSVTLGVAFVPKGRRFFWNRITNDQFGCYIIQRKLVTEDWSVASRVAAITDPSTVLFNDYTVLQGGTYHFRLRVQNKNGIYTDHNPVVVMVEDV